MTTTTKLTAVRGKEQLIRAMASDPPSPTPAAGDVYYNTIQHRLYVHDGTRYKAFAGLTTSTSTSTTTSTSTSTSTSTTTT